MASVAALVLRGIGQTFCILTCDGTCPMSIFQVSFYLRNKSWKPECVGSFNMDWRILVFYPEPEATDKIY